MSKFSGPFTALVTPFTSDGSNVDELRLRQIVDRVIAGGVHGIVPCGSTGEFNSMSSDERRRVVEIVVDQADGRVPIVPHTGTLTARESISLSKHAELTGASGVMVVAPFYEPLTMNEVKRFYLEVAASCDLDLMIYNLPVATGVNLTPEDVADLAEASGNIRYVKDTSFDWTQASRLIHEYGDIVSTFVGLDTMYAAVLLEGAAGTIVGASNFMPEPLVKIWDAVKANDLAEVRKWWKIVYPVMHFLTTVGYVAGVKAALKAVDFDVNIPRRPYEPLEGSKADEITTLMKVVQSNASAAGALLASEAS